MVDTYIISLLMCSIIALIVAIGVFTLKTVRNEKRIEELEFQIESINHFLALQNGTNKEINEAVRLMSKKVENANSTSADIDRKVSNILNKMTVSIHGKNVHMEGDVDNG
jgi:uncharacterized coiled-coil protein SlyX